MIYKETLFGPAQDPTLSYRIPALHAASDGAIYAFCEARLGTGGDWDPSRLQMRRRRPGGRWEAPVDVAINPHGPAHNPAPFEAGGALHLLYGRDYAHFYQVTSVDGAHFSAPEDITSVFESFRGRAVKGGLNWHCIAIGPGGVARLDTGRIVAPVWLGGLEDPHRHAPCQTATIYSDDDGASWRAGDVLDIFEYGPSEAQIAALPENSKWRALISLRNNGEMRRRGFAYSRDGIIWTKPRFAPEVAEINCQGSLLGFGDLMIIVGPEPEGVELLSQTRKRLTLRISRDYGATWSHGKVLAPGAAGYSALAPDAQGNLLCLYETWEDMHIMRLELLTLTPDEFVNL